MKDTFGSFVKFLRSSKRAILLITITAVITLIVSSLISIWLSRVTDWNFSTIGTIKTVGVEAYWDLDLKNKTEETFDWGTIYMGTSTNITLYLRSISNIETTLNLTAMNWTFYNRDKIVVQPPANISECMDLSWNYNETTVHPGEIIQVTLTLKAYSSNPFILYLITNDVEEFSVDISISTSEYSS